MDFDTVIAPLSRERFFADYWDKTFLFAKGKPGRFADVFSWDELNGLLEQQRLTPPLLKLMQEGRPLDPSVYSSPGWGNVPRVDPGRLIACLGGGATLVMACAEDLSQRVRRLSDALRDVFHAPNYANLYASWHAQKGLDLHWDSQDILVIQLAGRKHWEVYAPTRDHPLQGDIEAARKPSGKPDWEGDLEDGDILYLPRGWWHVASATSGPSLHLTFGTVGPTGVDFLKWLGERMRAEAIMRRDLPAASDSAGQAARLEELRAAVNRAMSDAALTQFLQEKQADGRALAHVRLPGAPYDQFAPIGDDSIIRLASSHQLAFAQTGKKADFKAYGALFGVPDYLMPALASLSDAKPLSVRELARKVSGEAQIADLKKSLSVLARAGVVLVTARGE